MLVGKARSPDLDPARGVIGHAPIQPAVLRLGLHRPHLAGRWSELLDGARRKHQHGKRHLLRRCLGDEDRKRQALRLGRPRRRHIGHRAVVAGVPSIDADLPILPPLDQPKLGSHPFERPAPRARPGQAAREHHQDQPRHPESGDAVQILEQRPPTQPEPRPECPRQPERPRPPQIQSRQDQHDRPARGELDQPIAERADQQ